MRAVSTIGVPTDFLSDANEVLSARTKGVVMKMLVSFLNCQAIPVKRVQAKNVVVMLIHNSPKFSTMVAVSCPLEALRSSLLYEVYMACTRPTSHHGLRFVAGYMTEI